MKINKNTNIAQLIAKDYSFAKVFESHSIDFYCNGNRSIMVAAKELGINIEQILVELEIVNLYEPKTGIDYRTWALDILADHIEESHHRFANEANSELQLLLSDLVTAYSDVQPHLLELQEVFSTLAKEKLTHMRKEEIVLFPFIRKMIKTQNLNSKISSPHFGSVKNPISVMIKEHEEHNELLLKIQELTSNYSPPEDATSSYIATYARLKTFVRDMYKHIHLENNILFPKAIALEETLEEL